MARQKVNALIIVALLIVGVNSTSAAVQVKPGVKCPNAGITQTVGGKKYTCIKSGKKLVWNKGVSITKLSPTPTPTSTPTSTPTFPNIEFPAHNTGTGLCEPQKNMNTLDLHAESQYVKDTKKYVTLWEKYNIAKPKSLRDVDQAAIASFATHFGRKRGSPAEVHISMQPDLTDDVSMQKLYRQLSAIGELFGNGFNHRPFEKPITMVVFKDWTWLRDEYISLGCSQADAQGMTESQIPYSVAAGWADPIRLIATFNFSKYQGKIGDHNLTLLGGHEIFHITQGQFINALTLKNQGRLETPGWFIEGGASLVGEMASNYLKESSFQYTKQAAQNIFQSGEAKILNLEDTNGTNWIYNMGLLGSDFLVSIVGFEKFVNIWSEIGKGKVFSDAFQDATGIELKDFYQMFQEIRPNLGIG